MNCPTCANILTVPAENVKIAMMFDGKEVSAHCKSFTYNPALPQVEEFAQSGGESAGHELKAEIVGMGSVNQPVTLRGTQ